MASIEYVKSYKDKELRQYILAYLLVSIAWIGFQTQITGGDPLSLSSLFHMIMTDIFVGAISILVIILNEIWSDEAKTKLIYGTMPSGTVFTNISAGKFAASGVDLEKAKKLYAHLSKVSSSQQTAEWNTRLRKCRDADRSNVVEAERMQLMTRDICMSTISLLIMNVLAIIVMTVIKCSFCAAIKTLSFPIIYLVAMLIVTSVASRNRANRFVELVIKNDVQDYNENN
jgi:hypothetical protein